MVKSIEVETSLGTFELVKPKAGVRNRAMMKSETENGGIKRVLFMTTLLPRIINKRPEACDSDVPIEQLLDSMEIEDYDLLIDGADKLMEDKVSENNSAQKKT